MTVVLGYGASGQTRLVSSYDSSASFIEAIAEWTAASVDWQPAASWL
jgi:hypothetical protein